MPEFWEWLVGVATSAAVVSGAAYLFRDTIAKFFSKAIEHQFEKRLEAFKGELRDNEKELEQIRSFLVSARRDRDSALQAKRFEAAEILMRARHGLSQFSMLVEYMKILNVEEILKSGDDPKIVDFVGILVKPFDVDEKVKQLGALDKSLPRLYLSEKSLKAYDAYESIVLSALLVMKLLSVPLRNKDGLLKKDTLTKTVVELLPNTKDDFEKFGESYAYHWATYFHDDILKSLRHEISGVDDLAKATQSAESLAIDSRRAQLKVLTTLEEAGLSKKLLKTDDAAAVATKQAAAT